MIDGNLRREIEEKREYIKKTPINGALAKAKKVKKALAKEATCHSFRIEYPDLALRYKSLKGSKAKREFKETLERTKENLEQAWRFPLKTYEGEITEEIIKGISGRIDPDLLCEDEINYRKDNARVLGSLYIPPRPEKISREMYSMINGLNALVDPIEKALMSHFHLARIHPFVDTNGRTARTMQNTILYSEGYVPSIIHEGERLVYFNLLESAVAGYREKDEDIVTSPEEDVFYNFLASKINMGLDEVVDSIGRYNKGKIKDKRLI